MGISSALGSSALLPAGLGFRNLLINGDMRVDQRYAGASVTPTATQYVVDRWEYQTSVASKVTVGQNLNSATPPAGFSKYFGSQTGSSANVTVGAGDYFCINYKIEGLSAAQLAWGTASAKPAVLSFWVRSSVTGTHGISFRNGNGTRSYPATYTISAANTWEYKTLQIPGDTSGTWATDNTTGVIVTFNLGMGSIYSGPAGAWASANYAAPNGAVKVVETNSATFQITGVQLEQNYQPTPFEQRPFGVELVLCQRYYQKSYPYSETPGSSVTSVGGMMFGSGAQFPRWQTVLPVQMRAAPNVTFYVQTGGNGSWNYWNNGSAGTATVGNSLITEVSIGTELQLTGPTSSRFQMYGHYVAEKEL